MDSIPLPPIGLPSSQVNGFPQAHIEVDNNVSSSRRPRSLFARRQLEKSAAEPVLSPARPTAKEQIWKDVSMENSEDLDVIEARNESKRMFEAMSCEERVRKRDELLASLPRELLENLQLSATSLSNEVKEEVVVRGHSTSSVRIEEGCDVVVNSLKMEWTKTISEAEVQTSPPSRSKEVRFGFSGEAISPSSDDIAGAEGLHHHGEDAAAPGYTLAELCKLIRSTVPAQRVMALNCITKILLWIPTCDEFCGIKGSELWRYATVDLYIVWLVRQALDTNNLSELAAALLCIRGLVCGSDSELIQVRERFSLETELGRLRREVPAPLQEEDQEEDERVKKPPSSYGEIISALLEMDLVPRLRYIMEVLSAPQPELISVSLHILFAIAFNSVASAVSLAECPRLLLVLRQLLDAKEEDVGVQHLCLQLVVVFCQSGQASAVAVVRSGLVARLHGFVLMAGTTSECASRSRNCLLLAVEALRALQFLAHYELEGPTLSVLFPVLCPLPPVDAECETDAGVRAFHRAVSNLLATLIERSQPALAQLSPALQQGISHLSGAGFCLKNVDSAGFLHLMSTYINRRTATSAVDVVTPELATAFRSSSLTSSFLDLHRRWLLQRSDSVCSSRCYLQLIDSMRAFVRFLGVWSKHISHEPLLDALFRIVEEVCRQPYSDVLLASDALLVLASVLDERDSLLWLHQQTLLLVPFLSAGSSPALEPLLRLIVCSPRILTSQPEVCMRLFKVLRRLMPSGRQSLVVEQQRLPSQEPAWFLSPALFTIAGQGADTKAIVSSVHALLLFWKTLWSLERRPTAMSVGELWTALLRTFLLGCDVFLDTEVRKLLLELSSECLSHPTPPVGFELARDVSALFSQESFGDAVFSRCIIALLHQSLPFDLRLEVLRELGPELFSLRCDPLPLPFAEAAFTFPVEESVEILKLYREALFRQQLSETSSPLLYKIAISHLAQRLLAGDPAAIPILELASFVCLAPTAKLISDLIDTAALSEAAINNVCEKLEYADAVAAAKLKDILITYLPK